MDEKELEARKKGIKDRVEEFLESYNENDYNRATLPCFILSEDHAHKAVAKLLEMSDIREQTPILRAMDRHPRKIAEIVLSEKFTRLLQEAYKIYESCKGAPGRELDHKLGNLQGVFRRGISDMDFLPVISNDDLAFSIIGQIAIFAAYEFFVLSPFGGVVRMREKDDLVLCKLLGVVD